MQFKVITYFIICCIVFSTPLRAQVGLGVSGKEQQLQSIWEQLQKAVDQQDLELVKNLGAQMNQVKHELGFTNIEAYSLALIERAKFRVSEDNLKGAQSLVELAQALSPKSYAVRMQSLKLVNLSFSQILGQGKELIGLFWRDPRLVIGAVVNAIYPALWALTLACYWILFLYISANGRDFFKFISRVLKLEGKFQIALAVGVLILALPCFFSVLWCLFVWGLVVIAFLRRERWLTFIAGILICLWGVFVPIRETMHAWVKDADITIVVKMSQSDYDPDYFRAFEKLLEKRPLDQLVNYNFAGYLRHIGKIPEARQQILRTQAMMDKNPYTLVNIGILDFLEGHSSLAKQRFDTAGSLGLDDAAYLFNYSKIHFDLTDTASSEKTFADASKLNSELVLSLRDREALLGPRSPNSFADINLPLKYYLASATAPLEGIAARESQVSRALMPGFTPLYIMASGLILIMAFLLAPEVRRSQLVSARILSAPPAVVAMVLSVLPGGALVMARRSYLAVVLIFVWVLLLLPMLIWPNTLSDLLLLPELSFDFLLGLFSIYTVVFVVFAWRVRRYV